MRTGATPTNERERHMEPLTGMLIIAALTMLTWHLFAGELRARRLQRRLDRLSADVSDIQRDLCWRELDPYPPDLYDPPRPETLHHIEGTAHPEALLRRLGFQDWEAVGMTSDAELLAMRGIGPTRLARIRERQREVLDPCNVENTVHAPGFLVSYDVQTPPPEDETQSKGNDR